MTETEVLNLLALARAKGLSPAEKSWLLSKAGSATAIISSRRCLKEAVPGSTRRMAEALENIDEPMRKAQKEMEFAIRENLDIIPLTAERYPQRLKQCADAPPVLFLKGEGELNPPRTVSIVGTRRCTPYGQDMVRRIVSDLGTMSPGLQIVSGLAYGIDINAHRCALQAGLPTMAVLAHGLDRLYPPAHRDTARQMLEQGGLLTENFTGTVPDKLHFLTRNRIVAGMSDVVIVIESAHHGGALTTARLARGYGRAVGACPGRVGDELSEGCNNLIREQKARLITSAEDLLEMMGWQSAAQEEQIRKAGVERTLFPDLTLDERQIANELLRQGDMQLNTLASKLQKPVGKLSAELFSLEMKGVLKQLAGGVYHLMK